MINVDRVSLRLANETLSAISLFTLSPIPLFQSVLILSTILLVIFSKGGRLASLTVGETMKIRATTAGSVK